MAFRKVDRQYYQAEAEAHIDYLGSFPSEEDAQLYASHVLRQPWYIELAGELDVTVHYVRRKQVCGTHRRRGKFYVDLTLGRLCEGVLIHELAHPPTYVPDLDHADHGPAFTRVHLAILDHMVDDWYGDQFRLALKKRGFVWQE